MTRPTALVVSAHAADFVWRAGGAIALHAGKGYDVTVLCLSFGERGESAKLWRQPGMTLEAVKSARRAEAEKAAGILGVADLVSYDIGDYPLPLTEEVKYRLVDLIRKVQPAFMLSHSLDDPYNTDHPAATRLAIEARMIAQAMGHKPGETILGAPQLYLFEPHQPERCGWKPDTILDITPVWEKKWAAIEAMAGQEHLWRYYRNVGENRGNQFERNSDGRSGVKGSKYAEAFQSLFPRSVGEL